MPRLTLLDRFSCATNGSFNVEQSRMTFRFCQPEQSVLKLRVCVARSYSVVAAEPEAVRVNLRLKLCTLKADRAFGQQVI